MPLAAVITTETTDRWLRVRTLLLLLAGPTFVGVGGCEGHARDVSSGEELNRTINLLRTQNAAYGRQVEELENRLFILNDKVDSQKVNDQRRAAPALPTEVLRPADVAQGPEIASDCLPAESDVEYLGEAAKCRSKKRPFLHLIGDELPVMSAPVVSAPVAVDSAPRIAVVGEKSAAALHGPAVGPLGPMALYRRSLEQLWAGHHDEASFGFRDFVRQWPHHDLADNAQYWLGESFYARQQFAQAAQEFRRVVERFPQGNKVPDALLKVGFSYLALGSATAGREALEQLVRSYPQHPTAGLATARLAELRSPGSRAAVSGGRAGDPTQEIR